MKSTFVGHALRVALALAVGLCAPSAFAQYYPYPYLEAECPDSSTGSYATSTNQRHRLLGRGISPKRR